MVLSPRTQNSITMHAEIYLQGASRVPGSRIRSEWPLISYILGLLLAFVVLLPWIIEVALPLRLAAIAVGAAIVAWESRVVWPTRETRYLLPNLLLWIISAVFAMSLYAQSEFNDQFLSISIQRLFIVFPLFLLAGFILGRSPNTSIYVRVLVLVGVFVAVLALTESLLGRSILGRDAMLASLQRGDRTRSLVAAEHTLVLGTILAALIPLAADKPTKLARLAAVVLMLGSWSTGSRGPIAMAIVALLIQFVPYAASLLPKHFRLVRASSILIFIGVVYLSVVVWEPTVRGSTGLEYSANYRPALYALLPEMLIDKPFGNGLGELPSGVYMISTDLYGRQDITETVDSEIVYSALSLGWLGVIGYVSVAAIAIASFRHSYSIGLSATILTLAGMFLALHAWDSLGPLWYLMTGMSLALVTSKSSAMCSDGWKTAECEELACLKHQ